MIERVFTQIWRFDVDGREIEVENRWNLVGFTRERLFVDGELVAQNRGWMTTYDTLVARVKGAGGLKSVRVRLDSRFWDVHCELDVDDLSSAVDARERMDANGPWGARPA